MNQKIVQKAIAFPLGQVYAYENKIKNKKVRTMKISVHYEASESVIAIHG